MIKRFIQHNGINILYIVVLAILFALFLGDGIYGFFTMLFTGIIILLINGFMEAKDKTITKISEAKRGKQKRHTEEFRKVFNTSLYQFWGILLFVFLCGLFTIWLFLESDDRQRTIIIFLFYFVLMIYVVAEAIYGKLIFTENGIEQRSLFYSTRVSWDEVIEVARLNRGNYVVICRAVIRDLVGEKEVADHKLTLPFTDNDWKNHEIRRIIETYAPQLEFIESTW